MEENKVKDTEEIVEEVSEENDDIQEERLEKNEDIQEEVLEEKEEKTPKMKKRKKKEIEELKEEIIKLQEELATTKNAYYKAYADTENLKKRLQNDADTLRKYRIQSFAYDILSAIDNLERALQQEAKTEEMKNYIEGIQMIYQQIMTSLQKEGVSVIEAKDKPFDPKVHQALIQEKVEGVESGIVLEEIQKGYMLKDRVLRATLVKVSE